MRKKEKSDSRADAAAKREKTIVRTGIAGVAANLILAAGKGAVGLYWHDLNEAGERTAASMRCQEASCGDS